MIIHYGIKEIRIIRKRQIKLFDCLKVIIDPLLVIKALLES